MNTFINVGKGMSLSSQVEERKYLSGNIPSNEATLFGYIDQANVAPLLEQIRDYCSYYEFIKDYNKRVTKDYKIEVLPFVLNISSGGGSCLWGLALMDALDELPCELQTHVYGMCASMAVPVYLKGDIRTSGINARFMFHGVSGGAMGYVEEMKADVNEAEFLQDSIDEFMMSRCKLPKKFFKECSTKCKWCGYDEMIKYEVINVDLYSVKEEVKEEKPKKKSNKKSTKKKEAPKKSKEDVEESINYQDLIGSQIDISVDGEVHRGVVVAFDEDENVYKVYVEDLQEILVCNI